MSNDPVTIAFKQHIGATDAAAHGRVLQDADVHAVDDDAVDGLLMLGCPWQPSIARGASTPRAVRPPLARRVPPSASDAWLPPARRGRALGGCSQSSPPPLKEHRS